MLRKPLYLVLSLLAIYTISCSILKKEDPDQAVRGFLTSFQTSLSGTDKQILAQFDAKQSREALLTIINILQNRGEQFIECTAAFNNPTIQWEGELAKVEIPVTFELKGMSEKEATDATLVLWLKSDNKNFVISKIEGEPFYLAFTSLKNRNEWAIDRELAMKERVWVYEKAKELEQKFDSVIWFATYNKKNYFYVVEGPWVNYFADYDTRGEKNVGVKMGLVDAEGNIIIPIEYDQVGTINFEIADLVEVIKDNQVGYFNLETQQLVVKPEFDVILPYTFDQAKGIVKKDSVYGWLDQQYVYHEGFPSSRAEKWVNDFDYLKRPLTFRDGNTVFAEIPAPDHAGFGILVPATYLVKTGIFNTIEGGISTTKVPLNGWTEYIETNGSVFEKISDQVGALFTAVTERYIEGREEFYTQNRISFINNERDTIGRASMPEGKITVRQVDSTLIEFTSPAEYDYYLGDYEVDELPLHTYFAIRENSVVKLESKRLFPQTQFVKLDSTYLNEKFYRWNDGNKEEATGISLLTWEYMRNEILDEYGYKFTDPELIHQFGEDGEYTTLEEIGEKLSDIDRHNLTFLDRIIESLKSKAV